jgi:coatomer subunit alpha
VWAKEEEVNKDVDTDEGGWELDADGEETEEKVLGAVEAPVEDEDSGTGATPGASETRFATHHLLLITSLLGHSIMICR